MTQDQLISSFAEVIALSIGDASERGLHPVHIANLLMMASLEIGVDIEGVDKVASGLRLAASNLERDHG